MNHVYKVVFNRALGVYQCVSEIAKSQGKSSGKSATSNSTNKISSTFKLTALSVGLSLLGASGSAMAVVYDNGQTTTITDNIYFSETDTVTNPNTVLSVNNILLSKTFEGAENKLEISNKATVNANNYVHVVDNSVVEMTNNAHLKANDIILGVNETSGKIIAETGSSIDADNLWLGNAESSQANTGQGIVTLDGASATIANEVTVGGDTSGHLTLQNKGQLKTKKLSLAEMANSKGIVDIKGEGSIINASSLWVGAHGNGTLNINDGGALQLVSSVANDPSLLSIATFGDINSNSSGNGNGTGTVNVSGAGSLINADNIAVGHQSLGKGILNIENNGLVTANNVMSIGEDGATKGEININGGQLTSKGLVVGRSGNGTLNGNNATINADELILGSNIVSEGNMTLDNNSTLSTTGLASFGKSGTGTLNLKNNSTLSSQGAVVLGGQRENELGTGNITVSSGSTLNADELVVGNVSKGNLTIEGGQYG